MRGGERSTGAESRGRSAVASRALRKQEVFVAEDDPDLRPAVGELLGEAGYRPVLFGTANELLAYLDRTTPAAIVTDMAMPGLSGSELVAELRKSERWRGIPVVVMTGNNDTALPLRVDAPVVYKPDIGNVVALIGTLLRKSPAGRR